MDAERMVRVCIARADLFLCTLAALPWGRALASLGVAAVVLRAAKGLRRIRAPDAQKKDGKSRSERKRTGGE